MDYLKKAGALLFSQMKELWEQDSFRYDLVDVTRQCLANESRILYARLMYCVEQGIKKDFLDVKDMFLKLIRTQENILIHHEAFGLKRFWIWHFNVGRNTDWKRSF